MTSFKSEYYQQVEDLFSQLKRDPFEGQLSDPTAYERDIPIEPSSWVENSRATVVIDDNGITITDGALTIIDQFGTTVLTGAGFGASWYDFIAGGVYNGAFQVGTTNDITAATIVNTASTEADYAASLSNDIPYWIVASESGAGSLQRFADANAVGGYALRWNGTESAEIFQDVPVVPGHTYTGIISWRYTNSTSEFARTITISYRDANHAIIGSEYGEGLTFTTTEAAYGMDVIAETGNTGSLGEAPANARYLRIAIEFVRNSGSPVVYLNQLIAIRSGEITTTRWLNEDGTPGTAVAAAGVVTLGFLTGDYLILNSTDDASLSSATQGLRIGSVTGANLIADNNEIMARNNGAAAELFLNNDGGAITTGSGTFTAGGNLQATGHFVLATASDGYIQLPEKAQGSGDYAAGTGVARLYVLLVAGKAQLRVRFETGAVQTIATEP